MRDVRSICDEILHSEALCTPRGWRCPEQSFQQGGPRRHLVPRLEMGEWEQILCCAHGLCPAPTRRALADDVLWTADIRPRSTQGSLAFQPTGRLMTQVMPVPAMSNAAGSSTLRPMALTLRPAKLARGSNSGVRGLAAAVADRGWAINNNAPIFTEAPAVQVTASSTKPEEWEGDLLFVPLMMAEGEDKKALAPVVGTAAAIDKATGGVIAELVTDNEFKGGPGSSVTTRLSGGKMKKISIVGAGKPDKFDVKGAIK